MGTCRGLVRESSRARVTMTPCTELLLCEHTDFSFLLVISPKSTTRFGPQFPFCHDCISELSALT